MNKPYNIQNTNICNGIFHISFFKALLINEGKTTQGEQDSGRNNPDVKAKIPSHHVRRTRAMALETFKILHDLAPPVLSDLICQDRGQKLKFDSINV
jgi:hypothetical protein